MKKYIFTAALIILFVSFVWAYKGTKGFVYKGKGGLTVPACSVMLCYMLQSYAETTLTNGMGYYELEVEKAGYYHLWGWKQINDTLWKKIYWNVYLDPQSGDELLEHDIILEPQ
jgi:hypothetical protein